MLCAGNKMFKDKKPGFINIHNDNLSLITYDKYKKPQCLESLSISNLLDSDTTIELPVKKIQDYDFSLMVVPDFWIGNRVYDFKSNDRSAIESFIARKLKLEFPKNPDIQNLFSYEITKKNKGDQEIVSLFIQESKTDGLLKRLAANKLRPVRITSPGLIWNIRLMKAVDSFGKQCTGLIYLIEKECFLLFFQNGKFLFSRTIPLPEVSADNSSRLDSLIYEINQSAYHFSQRTKSQLDKVLLISRGNDNVSGLKDKIGRNLTVLDEKTVGHSPGDQLLTEQGLIADFTSDDLFPTDRIPGVSDRLLLKEMEINKMQLIGLFIGLIFLVILGGEFLFLKSVEYRESRVNISGEEDPKTIIEHYNTALDSLLSDAEKEKPLSILGRLALSLPDNIIVESIELEQEPSRSLSFKGMILAENINDFSSALRSLTEHINTNLRISNPITMDDIEIGMAERQPGITRSEYHISFKLDLL
jgi:hypothetical protein